MEYKKSVALITGITGQDGSYLAELLLQKGYEVHGIKRPSSNFNTQRVEHLYQDPHEANQNFFLHYGDLTDSANILNIVGAIKPDEIYNLAAQSHVKISFDIPEYTAQVDAIGTLRILDALVSTGLHKTTKFYQASTSELFGLTNGKALNEDSPFYPRSPYGVAKLYSYWITKNYREAYGMFAVNGILFNHESSRRGGTFVTKKITSFLQALEARPDSILYLGNLDAVRDWGHAIDYVRAMWMTMQHVVADDWVVATGEAFTVRDFVNLSFAKCGLIIAWSGVGINEVGTDQHGKTRVRVDPRYFRPAEVPHLLGDSTKIRTMLGWQPTYNIMQIIEEMLSEPLEKTLGNHDRLVE